MSKRAIDLFHLEAPVLEWKLLPSLVFTAKQATSTSKITPCCHIIVLDVHSSFEPWKYEMELLMTFARRGYFRRMTTPERQFDKNCQRLCKFGLRELEGGFSPTCRDAVETFKPAHILLVVDWHVPASSRPMTPIAHVEENVVPRDISRRLGLWRRASERKHVYANNPRAQFQ